MRLSETRTPDALALLENVVDFISWIAKGSDGQYAEVPAGWLDEDDGDWGDPLVRDEYRAQRYDNIMVVARDMSGLRSPRDGDCVTCGCQGCDC